MVKRAPKSKKTVETSCTAERDVYETLKTVGPVPDLFDNIYCSR